MVGFTPLSLLSSPSGVAGGSLPSISTPISSSASSALNSSGSVYEVTSGGGGINFSPSPSSLMIIAGAALLAILIFKGRI